jgi:hypothetical protein
MRTIFQPLQVPAHAALNSPGNTRDQSPPPESWSFVQPACVLAFYDDIRIDFGLLPLYADIRTI